MHIFKSNEINHAFMYEKKIEWFFLMQKFCKIFLVLIIWVFFFIIWFITMETCIMIVLILQALLRQHIRNCAANFIQAFLTRSSTCLLLFPLENFIFAWFIFRYCVHDLKGNLIKKKVNYTGKLNSMGWILGRGSRILFSSTWDHDEIIYDPDKDFTHTFVLTLTIALKAQFF